MRLNLLRLWPLVYLYPVIICLNLLPGLLLHILLNGELLLLFTVICIANGFQLPKDWMVVWLYLTLPSLLLLHGGSFYAFSLSTSLGTLVGLNQLPNSFGIHFPISAPTTLPVDTWAMTLCGESDRSATQADVEQGVTSHTHYGRLKEQQTKSSDDRAELQTPSQNDMHKISAIIRPEGMANHKPFHVQSTLDQKEETSAISATLSETKGRLE